MRFEMDKSIHYLEKPNVIDNSDVCNAIADVVMTFYCKAMLE